MATSIVHDYRPDDEQLWHDLYTWLFSIIEMWVCCAGVAAWRGQQREIAEDITQEALLRTFKYNERARRGEVQPVISLKSLGKVIAQNHFRDRRKKDQRLVRPSVDEQAQGPLELAGGRVDPSQIALERVMFKTVMETVASVVVKFPLQQRLALLRDLANMSDFADQPTVLQQELALVGIDLRDYKQPLPESPSERGRYAAHLCIAYKRLKKKVQI